MDADDLCGVMGGGGEPAAGFECFMGKALAGGVKPVDGSGGMTQLREAVAEHDSPNVEKMAQSLVYRDSPWFTIDYTGMQALPYGRKAAIEASAVPMYVVSGWFDAATSDGALARFATFGNHQNVTVGPFSHGGGQDTDPYNPADGELTISRAEQFERLERFFAAHLKSEGVAEEPGLSYYVQGSGEWLHSEVWPPPGFDSSTLYFSDSHTLSSDPPASFGEGTGGIRAESAERYTVDYQTGTGGLTRWMTQLGGTDVVYDDRGKAVEGAVRYLSEPFAEDTELTGNVALSLWITSDQPDGAIHVYLDDIAPDGQARYLTEGSLRLIHRKVSGETPVYPTFGPYHSYLEADAQPMPVGEPQQVALGLYATSALIRSGHRLQISISAADATSFARIPGSEPVQNWQIHRGLHEGRMLSSSVTLPLRPWHLRP